MRRSRGNLLLFAAGVLMLAAGCRTAYTESDQNGLAESYYCGDFAAAASRAAAISEEEKSETSLHALLWHLEAGNANLDAGNYKESLRCLERAEKLLYLFDSGARHFQRPGMSTYRGARSDRLLLHLLKGFNYLADGSLEDFMVEIRRLRAEQFRYVLTEASPELRRYEAVNFGKKGVAPWAMRNLLRDSDKKSIFQQSGLSDGYTEYSERRRPELPLFYNPLAFYLSAIGYAFDGEYEEAVIDFRYLLMLDPGNQLYRQDYAALLRALGDPLPKDFGPVFRSTVPDDQVVYFVVARGRPDGWKSRQLTYQLPDKVPTDWSFSFPDYHKSGDDPGFSVRCGAMRVAGTHLADLSDIMNEEYWQKIFPEMVDRAEQATEAMTAANKSAKASLAAALALPQSDYKALAVAAATAAVAATSRASVTEQEWRRWITLPRSYSVAHIALPPQGRSRKMTLAVNSSAGKKTRFELDFAPETNRAVVYLREVDNGKFALKNWESRE